MNYIKKCWHRIIIFCWVHPICWLLHQRSHEQYSTGYSKLYWRCTKCGHHYSTPKKERVRMENHTILIDALTDALGRSEGQSLEEVKEDLRNAGIDVDVSVKSLIESVKGISMTAAKKYSNQSSTTA